MYHYIKDESMVYLCITDDVSVSSLSSVLYVASLSPVLLLFSFAKSCPTI